jgi:hypothetical protein
VDPHIHVEVNLNRNTVARKMLASTFGLASDLPTTVTSGCGEQVSIAMTSPRPDRVTCLPCREHAARWHNRAANRFDEGGTTALTLRTQHRDLARRFAET